MESFTARTYEHGDFQLTPRQPSSRLWLREATLMLVYLVGPRVSQF